MPKSGGPNWWRLSTNHPLYPRGLTARVLLGALLRPDAVDEHGARASGRVIRLLGGQALLLLLVAVPAFWLRRDDLLGYIDGQYLLTVTRNRLHLTGLDFALSSNPLQGLGELWYFSNTLWMPEFLPAQLFSNADLQIVGTHTVAAVELFLLAAGLTIWLGASLAQAAVAGWLTVILIAPITFPSLIYNISPDAPQFVSIVAIPLLLVPLWAAIGKHRPVLDVVLAGLIVGLLWLHLITVGLFTLLCYPFIGVFGAAFLIAAWRDRREFRRKLLYAAAILVLLAASGHVFVLAGVISDTAFHFFADDWQRTEVTLSDGSLLFRTSEPAGVVATAFGLVGAVVAARFGGARTRCFAVATLTLAAGIYALSIVRTVWSWTGAIPIYYEYPLWVVYPLFAASLIFRLGAIYLQHTKLDLERLRMAGWLIAPIAAVLIVHGANARIRGGHNGRPNVYPPTPTKLTDYLRDNVSIALGAPFRGRVATMTGQNMASAGWGEIFSVDLDLIRRRGNEHRNIGLWYYDIPTLFTFSHTIDPLYYALVKRYLACPSDTQFRTVINIRCPNLPVLRLLGVRYLIADSTEPVAGTVRRRELAATDAGERLAVDEISEHMIGFSPTEVVQLGSQAEALSWLGNPDVDLEHQAALEGRPPAPLTAAENISITLERDGMRVKAQSSGSSLVVIPFQFSRCWQVNPHHGTAAPEIRRADFLLLGLLFKGTLDTSLTFRLGPLQGRDCRLQDAADSRLLLAD